MNNNIDTVKAVILPTGNDFITLDISTKQTTFTEIVKGMITKVKVGMGVNIYYNKNHLTEGLESNFMVNGGKFNQKLIGGNVVFCGTDSNGDVADLTDIQMDYIVKAFHYRFMFVVDTDKNGFIKDVAEVII